MILLPSLHQHHSSCGANDDNLNSSLLSDSISSVLVIGILDMIDRSFALVLDLFSLILIFEITLMSWLRREVVYF